MAMQYSIRINGKVLSCMAILLLVTINLMELAGASSNGRKIDYGVVRQGKQKPCTKANPQYCKKKEANPYQRGCNKAKGCRHPPGYEEEIIVGDNHNKLPLRSDLPSPVSNHHHSHHRHHHGHLEKTNTDAYDNKSFE